MTTEIVIRDGTEADMPAVTAIYARSVREETASFELLPPDLAEMTRRRDAMKRHEAHAQVRSPSPRRFPDTLQQAATASASR